MDIVGTSDNSTDLLQWAICECLVPFDSKQMYKISSSWKLSDGPRHVKYIMYGLKSNEVPNSQFRK